MAEYLSGTESEQTAEESSQDEFNTIEIEATEGETSVLGHVCALEDDSLEPYADEPLADEEWLRVYRKEQKEKRQLEEELKKRLENRVRVGDWCTCGKCCCDLLANISECYCCKELGGCCEALVSDIVVQDLQEGQVL